MAKEDSKKGFVWRGLRIGFYAMIAVWLINSLYAYITSNANPSQDINAFMIILSLLFLVLLIFNFVLSIIHLIKHKDKKFAIIALIVCSLAIILNIIGFVVTLINILAQAGQVA